ncbi:MAG: GNAT family N-acetyltransferase [Nocardioides sp.]
MNDPTADVSVRIAWSDDAAAIAAIQARAWATTYAELVPGAGKLREADFAQQWREALAHPADARHRALVALERNRVVGFAITTPATDPDCDPVSDGELMELTVEAGERGRGHGSRLLQAAVDTLAADRFTRAVTWLVSDDDELRAFLTEAGWAADTAHRTLDLDGTGATQVRQIRLHTSLA